MYAVAYGKSQRAESLQASKSIVFWSTLLLVVIQMGVAIVLNQEYAYKVS